MAHFDLTHLTDPASQGPFVIDMPDGKPLELRPVVALPSDGQAAMLRLSGRLAKLGDGEVDTSQMLEALAEALPDVDTLIKAACPSKTAAAKLMKLLNASLQDKIQLAVSYITQDQAGEASPSAS